MIWPMAQIKDVAKVVTGKTPSKKHPEFFGGDIPFVTPAEIGVNKFVSSSPQTLTNEGAAKVKIVPKCSVMVCCIGSLGKTSIADCDLATNQQINTVVFDDAKVDFRYGYYALKRLQPKLEAMAPATTVAIVNKSNFESLEIPLPPLEEQKHIAAILDKADAVRRKRQQAIELSEQFLKSVFLDMFGDPVTNPKGWAEKPLSAGIVKIESGWSASGDNAPAKEGQLGVLKISSVTSGVFRPEENKSVEIESIPSSKKLLKPCAGDLLFSRANTRELVAATAIVDQDYDNLFLPDKLWKIGTGNNLVPEYLHFLLKHPRMKDKLTSQATGTSGSMLNISKKKFEETEAMFPSRSEQEAFAMIVNKVWSLRSIDRKSDKELSYMFASISQQAFSGDLLHG